MARFVLILGGFVLNMAGFVLISLLRKVQWTSEKDIRHINSCTHKNKRGQLKSTKGLELNDIREGLGVRPNQKNIVLIPFCCY